MTWKRDGAEVWLQVKTVVLVVGLLVGIATALMSGQEESQEADLTGGSDEIPDRPIGMVKSAADQFSSVPFKVGERLAYRVSWLETLEAGTAELTVTSRDPKNSGAYRLRVDARTTQAVESSYSLNFRISSIFDLRLGASLEYRKSFEEKKRVVRESIVFNPLGRLAIFVNSKKESQVLPIEIGTQDPVSAMYFVRSFGLKPGLRFFFPIVEGGKTYQIDVTVVGTELISTGLGSFSTQRVKAVFRNSAGLLADSKMTFWFTNDHRRIPVLAVVSLPLGSLLLELILIS